MMKILIRHRFATALFFCLSTGLVGCASRAVQDSGTTVGLESLDEQEQHSYHQALTDLEEGSGQSAMEILEQLVRSDPHVREVWLNLALAQYRRNDLNRARDTVDKILGRWQSTAPASNLAGLIALRAGEIDAARSHFEQALSADPNYTNALFNMALLLDVYLQDIPEAVHYYQQYLAQAGVDDETEQWVEELKLSLDRADLE